MPVTAAHPCSTRVLVDALQVGSPRGCCGHGPGALSPQCEARRLTSDAALALNLKLMFMVNEWTSLIFTVEGEVRIHVAIFL